MSAVTNAYGENPYNQQSSQIPTATTPLQAGSPPTPYAQPYGQPYGAPPPEHPQGTLILIFGIIGAFVTIFAPIAWYLGSRAKQEIQASGLQYANEPHVNAGRILGKIFSIIWLVFIGLMILAFAVALLVGAEAPANPAPRHYRSK
jgi:hypothetical protein